MTIASVKHILLDTSVWIDYFRKIKPIQQQVEKMIEEERIATCRFVVAELLQGARSKDHFSTLKEATEVFHLLIEKPDTWSEAARVSSQLIQNNKKVGLGDCYIAALATQHVVPLWTFDNHFKTIQSILPLKLYEPAKN